MWSYGFQYTCRLNMTSWLCKVMVKDDNLSANKMTDDMTHGLITIYLCNGKQLWCLDLLCWSWCLNIYWFWDHSSFSSMHNILYCLCCACSCFNMLRFFFVGHGRCYWRRVSYIYDHPVVTESHGCCSSRTCWHSSRTSRTKPSIPGTTWRGIDWNIQSLL